ncbi:MAG: cysteine desulfurase family protein [Candidatus Shapirobacteria bacterium]|nr:cysteine desulfurase family protein [Candidatus Shapirobacteria bacterium]
MLKKKIYLDYAATSPVTKEVLAAMKHYFSQDYGNPSEPHLWGQKARFAIDKSRQKIADFLGAKPQEIIFTSGATEAINLAHKGLIEAIRDTQNGKPHIITSLIEHKAVLETCQHLEKLNWAEVTYLPVDKDGLIKIEDLKKAIKPETVLISVMYVNNEVGIIEPIREIGQLIKKINQSRITNHQSPIYFHTDVTQALQYLNCNVDYLGVDLLSLSGHKFYVPKGVGLLYFRKKTPLVRQQDGGGQEYRLRAGTENVPYIVGLGKAIELVQQNKVQSVKLIKGLREKLVKGILKNQGVRLMGSSEKNAPHIATFLVEGAEGEAMLLLFSEKGIAVSSGSACTSGLLQPSHVLTAMGVPPEKSHGSLRFSLGKENTSKEIDYVIEIFPEIINKLRKMAPNLDIFNR